MPEFGGTYSQGLVDVTNGSAVVPGTGVLWTDVLEGDALVRGGALAFVLSVNEDFDELMLKRPWPGSTALGATYDIYKTSWLRYEPALLQAKVRELLQRLNGVGIIYAVTGDAPDAEIGDDNDYALKTNTAVWKLWLKVDGEWVLQSTPAGIDWLGAWSALTNYVPGQGVSRLGRSYRSKTSNTNQPPETNPDDWDLLADSGGRYDLAVSDNDRPATGETLIRHVFTTSVTFPAGLTESRADSVVAAAASAVFSLRKNGAPFGTATFALGSTTATFAAASDTAFAAGDVLTIVAPDPRDATLSGVAMTLAGFR
jgi:hypothetical protein